MAMRMERLFRDFEAQLASEHQRSLELDAQEVRKLEYGKIQQIDRLAGQIGSQLRISSGDSLRWEGVLESVGKGWILLRSHSENILIPTQSINWWEGGSPLSRVETGSISRQLTLTYAMRALASGRVPVRIFHQFGSATSEGTIEKVGFDFFEMGLHPIEGSFRSPQINGWRTIPMQQVSACCSLVR